MRLEQPESAVAGNPLNELMLRKMTVGICIRNTRDNRIDSVRLFQSNDSHPDDSSIHCKEECSFSMSRMFSSWSLMELETM